MGYGGADDFSFEGPEDDEFEIYIDVYDSGSVAYESFRGGNEGVEADAEADFVDYFVGVFGVDEVFDCADAGFCEVFGRDLDYVCYCYLEVMLMRHS